MNTPLAIEGELTVFTAHDTKARFLAAMSAQGELTVNLEAVSEFDGAGLQLLLATQHESQRRGGALRLTSLPPAVQAAMALTGLTTHFATTSSDTQGGTS